MRLDLLHIALSAAAPILGISVGSVNDKSTWRIDFDPSATLAQQAAAQVVLQAFDVAAEEAAETSQAQRNNDLTIQAKADAVVQQLLTATPTQIVNYVQNNVTDLASAKVLMAKLAVAIAFALQGKS